MMTSCNPIYGPEVPPSLLCSTRPRKKRHKIARVMALLAQLLDLLERAECSHERCHWRCQLRDLLHQRRSSLLTTEFVTVFRMSPHAMERLTNALKYPFLVPSLSEANITGRQDSNRRPLTVDEKISIGCIGVGGCPLGGLMWSFGVTESSNLLIVAFLAKLT